MHCIAGSCSLAVIVLLFDGLNRYNAWHKGYYANFGIRRSLKSELLDSYGNGEENASESMLMRSLLIENEVNKCHFVDIFTLAALKMTQQAHNLQLSYNSLHHCVIG